MAEYKLDVLENEAPKAELDQITGGLQSHGVQFELGLPKGAKEWYVKKDVYVSHKDPNDPEKVLGGCCAYTVGGLLYVTLLWVDDSMRGKGLGSVLLNKAENIARERGCDRSYLDTFSFQGPNFYPKLGYKALYTIKGCFDGNSDRIYFEKYL